MARRQRSKRATQIRRTVARELARKIQEDEQQYANLVDSGIIDHDLITTMVESGDIAGIARQAKAGIRELARQKPSILDDLDIHPLDVLTGSPPEVPTGQGPDERLSAVTTIDQTIVFSDLEGFTAFTRRRGDAEASAVLTDHYAAIDAITAGRGGWVVKRLGDGNMLAFQQPAAAVLAVLELVDQDPAGLALRAGAHHGSVIEMQNDLFGDVVNVAARVTDLAVGGQALVTGALRDQAIPMKHVLFDPSESRRLDGIDTPVEVCSVRSL